MKEPQWNEFARKLLILLSRMLKVHMIKWEVFVLWFTCSFWLQKTLKHNYFKFWHKDTVLSFLIRWAVSVRQLFTINFINDCVFILFYFIYFSMCFFCSFFLRFLSFIFQTNIRRMERPFLQWVLINVKKFLVLKVTVCFHISINYFIWKRSMTFGLLVIWPLTVKKQQLLNELYWSGWKEFVMVW